MNRKAKPCGNQSMPHAARSNHPMTQCSFLFPVLPVNFHFWEVMRVFDNLILKRERRKMEGICMLVERPAQEKLWYQSFTSLKNSAGILHSFSNRMCKHLDSVVLNVVLLLLHPRRPSGSHSGREKRRNESFQAQA